MKKIVIHQITATMSKGDAISNEVLAIQELLQDMGIQSEIYAENIDTRLTNSVKSYKTYYPKKEDIIIHHFGIGSEVNTFVSQLVNKHKLIRYHNITPDQYFSGYNPMSEKLCRWGREQLAQYLHLYTTAVADSEYNKQELLELGYKQDVRVIPILLALKDYEQEPSNKIISQYKDDGMTNLLFVGRIAPNKKQEDVIKVFYHYKKYYNSKARLFLVGSYSGMERYYEQLKKFQKGLDIDDIIFTGHIPFKEILAYYHLADIFVCMSEHEGFCVPLVESMFFEVPILAYDKAAISSTLGKSGVLVKEKKYRYISGMIDYMVTHREFTKRVTTQQIERLEELKPEAVKKQLRDYLKNIIGEI